MGIREILVGAEEVLEEGNVLCQQGAFSECFRCCRIVRVAAIIPAFRLQHIDDVLTRHKVGKAAADSFAHFLLLMLGIQRDNGFAGLQQVQDEQLHEVGFALTGVAEDKDIGGGLVLVALIEVHEDVAAILVPSDIEALCVRFTAVIEGVEICYRACRQDTLELRSEGIVSHRAGAAEALLLAEQESVHIELASHQLRQHIGLEQFERVMIRSGQLDVNGTMEQRLFIAVAAALHGDHVLQIAFRRDRLLQVICVGAAHAVFVGGILDNALFLGRCELPGIDTQGDAVLLAQMPQQSLLVGLGRVFPQSPHAAEGVAADEVVGIKLHHGGCDHIQEGFDRCVLRVPCCSFFLVCCQVISLLILRKGPSVRRRDPRTARWSRSAQSRLPASF